MSAENEWVVEGVVQFVKSPMWTVPVHDFIDTYCILFDNEEEMKLEYTEIHRKFQTLIDDLLTTYLEELGFPQEQFVEVLQAIDERSGGANRDVRRLLEYITYLDDFVSFRALMQKRNVELELEVMRALQREMQKHQHEQQQASGDGGVVDGAPSGGEGAPAPPAGDEAEQLSVEEQERRDLEAAIRLSMEDATVIMKAAEAEDAELQHALLMSIKEEEARVEREKQRVAAAQAEEAAKQAEIARLEADTRARQEAMTQQTLQQRANVVARAVQDVHAVAPDTADAVIAGKTAAKASAVAAAASAATTAAQATIPAPPNATVTPIAPDVVHISAGAAVTGGGGGGLAPIGGGGGSGLAPLGAPLTRHGTFGARSVLPSIHSFGQVRDAVAQQPGVAPPPPPPPQSGSAKDEVVSKLKQGLTKEEFEERAKMMKEQRDKLLAQKRSDRSAELTAFKVERGIADSPDPRKPEPSAAALPKGTKADGTVDDAHKKIAVEIARRFRMDIVEETRKGDQ